LGGDAVTRAIKQGCFGVHINLRVRHFRGLFKFMLHVRGGCRCKTCMGGIMASGLLRSRS
jgi:hypothetical protein